MHVMAVAIQLDLPNSLEDAEDLQALRISSIELLNFVSFRLTHQPMFQHYTANLRWLGSKL